MWLLMCKTTEWSRFRNVSFRSALTTLKVSMKWCTILFYTNSSWNSLRATKLDDVCTTCSESNVSALTPPSSPSRIYKRLTYVTKKSISNLREMRKASKLKASILPTSVPWRLALSLDLPAKLNVSRLSTRRCSFSFSISSTPSLVKCLSVPQSSPILSANSVNVCTRWPLINLVARMWAIMTLSELWHTIYLSSGYWRPASRTCILRALRKNSTLVPTARKISNSPKIFSLALWLTKSGRSQPLLMRNQGILENLLRVRVETSSVLHLRRKSSKRITLRPIIEIYCSLTAKTSPRMSYR